MQRSFSLFGSGFSFFKIVNFLKTTRLFYGTIELGKLRDFWEWKKEKYW